MTPEVVIAYHAKEQFNRLSKEEKVELTHLLSEPDRLKRSKQIGGPGRYVSHLGQDKRVYWEMNGGKVVVLSVVARNAA